MKTDEFVTSPAVFAVDNTYQILTPVTCDMLFWIEVGREKYFDHSNGILRSDTRIHRVSIPTEALDEAGEYTVCYKKIIERKPYNTETEETKRLTYRFYPVRQNGKINIYHLADTHGDFDVPSKTGTYFGEDIDLLILNGDILDHSGRIENFLLTFRFCEAITKGEHPCIFSRGNHDLRGFYAEKLADYCPNSYGKSYYTFRLGKIWGIVLDCGEDKIDSHEEYGSTVCCTNFRKEETQFLEEVSKRGEHLENGIEYRFVIVHNPFTFTLEPPFDIEQKLFKRWADILKNVIKPDAIISGHLHETYISEIGGKYDSKGQPCPVIIGSRQIKSEDKETDFIGCAITLEKDNMLVSFTDSAHNVIDTKSISLVI